MSKDFDVVVLGGGTAGCAAALCAAQQHARVCVIVGAPGATALFAGAWRGACPDDFRRALSDVGYELATCSRPLPHPMGTVSAADLAPPTHAAAQLDNDSVVFGIAGVPGFHAASLAQQWSTRSGMKLRAATLTISGTPAAGWAYASLAATLERDPDVLIQPLSAALKEIGSSRAILPAVLGLSHDSTLHARISAATGNAVGEALGVPPSLPGWRLHHALQQVLARAGVHVLEGRAVVDAHERGRARAVRLQDGDVVTGRSFVLATGKYAAGGIEADGAFREPAFDCPVWVEHLDEAFESSDPLILTDPVYSEDQPLLRAGVHTDAEHRPVNRAGDVVFENVFVAGSLRADWDNGTHGMGAAAEDGWRAGTIAVSAR